MSYNPRTSYSPSQGHQGISSRVLNTLLASALVTAACGSPAQGPLQGTLLDKFNDPDNKRIVLEVLPTYHSEPLGIRLPQETMVVVLPYSAGGNHMGNISSFCGIESNDRYKKGGDRCYIDAQAKRSGEAFEITQLKDVKRVPQSFARSQAHASIDEMSNRDAKAYEAQKARDSIESKKPKKESWRKFISRLSGF